MSSYIDAHITMIHDGIFHFAPIARMTDAIKNIVLNFIDTRLLS